MAHVLRAAGAPDAPLELPPEVPPEMIRMPSPLVLAKALIAGLGPMKPQQPPG